jgi:hypothetical protein
LEQVEGGSAQVDVPADLELVEAASGEEPCATEELEDDDP